MPGFTRDRLGTQYDVKTGARLSTNEMLRNEAIDITRAQGGDRFSYGDSGELQVHQPIKSPDQIGAEQAKEYMDTENEETYKRRVDEGVMTLYGKIGEKGMLDDDTWKEYQEKGDHMMQEKPTFNERGDMVIIDDETGEEITVTKEKRNAMLQYHARQVANKGKRARETEDKEKYYKRQEGIAKVKREATDKRKYNKETTDIYNVGGKYLSSLPKGGKDYKVPKGWKKQRDSQRKEYIISDKAAIALQKTLDREKRSRSVKDKATFADNQTAIKNANSDITRAKEYSQLSQEELDLNITQIKEKEEDIKKLKGISVLTKELKKTLRQNEKDFIRLKKEQITIKKELSSNADKLRDSQTQRDEAQERNKTLTAEYSTEEEPMSTSKDIIAKDRDTKSIANYKKWYNSLPDGTWVKLPMGRIVQKGSSKKRTVKKTAVNK